MRLQKGFSIAITLALLLTVLSIVTIAGAYYFIEKTRNNGFEENMVTLNSLQRLDAKWSENILKTHNYTLQDFDQLTSYMIKIRQALGSLNQRGMSDEKIVGKKTAKQYQIYKHSFATKNEAVENYKSEQAIVRNSVRYLPEAGEIAQQALAESSDQQDRLTNNLLNISTLKMNQYLLNTVSAEKVKKTLEKLESQDTSADIKAKMQDYFIHSRLVIKHKPEVDKTLQSAMSVDIATLSNNLVNQYAKSQDAVKQRIKKLQQIILAGAAILLALLVWFLFRLRNISKEILLASAKNKTVEQQLLESEAHVKQANINIAQIEQQAASGQLSLTTFKHLSTSIPALATHISFLKNLKENQVVAQYKDKMDLMIGDMDGMYNNLYQLNTLIDPQKNKDKQVSFDFNHVIQSAFKSVSEDASTSAKFNKQLSSVPKIRASSTDLFQITTKLLQQAATTWHQGNESIFVKTWATGHYANLCISIFDYDTIEALYKEESLADLGKLLEQNSAIIKLTPREEGKSSIIWVSFPYGK